MKHVVFILLSILLNISCQRDNRKDEKQNRSDANYGTQLLDKGFLEFADSLKVDSLKPALVNAFNIYDERNNKIANIDAEELAEFSFDFFLPRLNEILGKRNFRLDVQVTTNYEETYEILINKEQVKLYTVDELENQTFWDTAPRNFFKVVNKQLKRSGINESFYLLYHGNDLSAVLLTEDQFNVIADKYKDDIEETPYLP